MGYSNTKVPMDATLFPPPQEWITWVAETKYSSIQHKDGSYTYRIDTDENGRVRHYDTLAKARRSLAWIGSKSKYKEDRWENVKPGVFLTDWAVFHWNGTEWEKVYEGVRGEKRDDNPLFQRRFKADEKVDPLKHNAEKQAEEALLASLHESLTRAS